MDNERHKVSPKCFKRLEVPHGWTAEQDIQVFVARFGEADDYFGEALASVDNGYDQLEQCVDQALVLVGRNGISKAHIIHRVDMVRRVLSRNSSAKARFLSHLDYTRFALVEYFRLIPCYLHHGDRNWLAPLVQLSDCLNNAAMRLSEAIRTY
jgi:hypothetical protein